MIWRVALSVALLVAIACGPASASTTRTLQTSVGEIQFAEDGAVTILADTEDLDTTLHVAADGQLTRDDAPIPTDKGDRKLLREFARESEKLADLLDEVSALVARQVDPETDPGEMEDLGKDLADLGKKLEKQNLKLARITGKLVDRNPELEVFGSLFAE